MTLLFANLFSVWLNIAGFSYLLPHWICFGLMLWLKYREKNLASHKYIGMFLFLLQISVGIFLILHQNSTSVASKSLIAMWNLRPYFALQRIFYHVTFSNFRYCSSEKYWLTELYRSLNVDILHYTISKLIIVFYHH